MIDNGRQFFSRAWLTERIKELAGLKLNLLHLHFSDNQGFRLESRDAPGDRQRPAPDEGGHAQAGAGRPPPPRDDRARARRARPPARRRSTPHPELQLENAAGQKQPDKLDVTLPEARQFIADLLGEYLPLFPGPWWHTGADEYLGIVSTEQDYELYPQLEAYADAKYGDAANGKDAVLDFVNFVAEHREAGRQAPARLVGRDRGRQRGDARPGRGRRVVGEPQLARARGADERRPPGPERRLVAALLRHRRPADEPARDRAGDVRGLGPVRLRGPVVDALGERRPGRRALRGARRTPSASWARS